MRSPWKQKGYWPQRNSLRTDFEQQTYSVWPRAALAQIGFTPTFPMV